MMEAVGFCVRKLVRTGIGPITLAGLQVGQMRELTAAEVRVLRASILGLGLRSNQARP